MHNWQFTVAVKLFIASGYNCGLNGSRMLIWHVKVKKYRRKKNNKNEEWS